jgi:nitroreductase
MTNTALVERRSVRKYLPEPVPDELVREILTEARWAPSATNTQSTYVYALSGEPLKRYKADLRERSEANGLPAPDIEINREWPPALQARMSDLLRARTSFVAAEEQKLGKPQGPPVSPLVAMAELFGAPVLLVLAFDKAISVPYGCFDAALLAQSLALAAHTRGLGTCITASTIRYADLLRRVIPGTEDKNFVIAISLGYPDWEAAINRFPRERAPLEEWVTFVR